MPDELEFSKIPIHTPGLHVAQAGPAEDPLVILLHGFLEFWYGWHTPIGQGSKLASRLELEMRNSIWKHWLEGFFQRSH